MLPFVETLFCFVKFIKLFKVVVGDSARGLVTACFRFVGGGTAAGGASIWCFCSACGCFLVIDSSLTGPRVMGLIIPTGTAATGGGGDGRGSLSLLVSVVSIFGGGVGGTGGAAAAAGGGSTGGCGPCCLSGKYGLAVTWFFLKLKLKDSPPACLILSIESLETILMPSSMSMALLPLWLPLFLDPVVLALLPLVFHSELRFLSMWRNGGTSNLFFLLLGLVGDSTLLFEVVWYFLLDDEEVVLNSGLAGRAGLAEWLLLLLTRDLFAVLAGEAVRGLVVVVLLGKCKSFFFEGEEEAG